jgi:hypothetical protein
LAPITTESKASESIATAVFLLYDEESATATLGIAVLLHVTVVPCRATMVRV